MTDITAALKDWLIGPAHIGFVVKDLEAAIADAAKLYGFTLDSVRHEPEPGVEAPTRFAFFELAGLTFEYIQPCSDEFVDKLFSVPSGGGGINHVAWRVSDITAAVDALARRGIRPGYVTPDGVITIGNKKMVYLDPATTGGLLVELLEYADE